MGGPGRNMFEVDGGVPQVGVTAANDPYKDQIQMTEGVRASGALAQQIVAEGNRFRASYPWLFRHQNAIGLMIFMAAIAGIVGGTYLLYSGDVAVHASSWMRVCAVIANNGFWMSILHELEHDLIHYMYFRHNWWAHNLMMLGIWVFRPNSSSGWVRRRMHLHHHRVSGTPSDLEERTITNGYPWGWRRLVMTGDHVLSWMMRIPEMTDVQRRFLRAQPDLITKSDRRWVGYLNMLALFPLGNIFYATWHAYLVWRLWRCLAATVVPAFLVALLPLWTSDASASPIAASVDAWMRYLAVVLYIPSVVRVFSLQFVSSNMHYYGDVEPGNVLQQTQVWTAWWLAPLHFFCFNFGGTHAIHHFVARETFYVRQLTARRMYPMMKSYGVRFNDFGSLWRANRRGPYNAKTE